MLSTAGGHNSSLLNLLQLVQVQIQFSTVLVLSDTTSRIDSDIFKLGVAVIQHTTSEQYSLKKRYNNEILVIAYTTLSSYKDILNILTIDLHGMAQTKIIFVISPEMESVIREFFNICWSKKMINAIGFLKDNHYYSYTPFPEMRITLNSVNDKREVFPNRLLNLHGHPLRIVMDGVEPRDFIYTNREGNEVLGGYTISFLVTLAQKLNATLTTHAERKNVIFYHTDYQQLFTSDVVDIFGGLVMLIPTTIGQSAPAEIIEWCLMLPVEPNLPQYLYFPIIFESLPMVLMFAMVFVFSFILNAMLWLEGRTKEAFWKWLLKEDCFRALLGQSCQSYRNQSMKLRMVFFLCCILGLFFNTQYLAALNKLVTTPPSEPRILSWDDIRQSSIKVLMYRGEFDDISQTTDELMRYKDAFLLLDNNTFYHITRNSMNRSFAYPVPTNKWKMFEQQQSFYKVPIFRYTSKICVVRYTMMVFLLNENSIFTKALNEMILRTHESGLYEQWVRKAFLQLVEAGRIHMNSHWKEDVLMPLALDDMRWLWGLFGVLAAINCAVFIFEVFHNRVWKN